MKSILFAMVSLVSLAAVAGPVVTVLDASQDKYTRTVKVTYKLEGGPAVTTFDVQLDGVSIGDAHTTYCTGEIHRLLEEGEHSFVWDARRAWPDHKIDDGALKVVVNAWDPSMPPDYMVVWPGTGNINYYTSAENLPDGGLTNDVYRTQRIVMRKIKAGSFMMGSTAKETQREVNESNIGKENYHKVNLTHDYYMGIFEITQGQWKQEMGVSTITVNAGGNKAVAEAGCVGDTKPMHSVNISDVAYTAANTNVASGSFCGKLAARTGIAFCLPTEAEWEYACRAGTIDGQWNDGSAILNSDTDANLAELALYSKNAHTFLNSVGSKKPNAWGLYDMHGSLGEYVRDFYKAELGTQEVTDPSFPEVVSVVNRVNKGGNFRHLAKYCRPASRLQDGGSTGGSWWTNGFRLSCPAIAK